MTWHGLPTPSAPRGRKSEVDFLRKDEDPPAQVTDPTDALPIPKKKMRHIGFTAALRELKPGQSRWIPSQSANAHTLATRAIGKGNFVVRSENRGSRVWRKA